MIRRTLQEIADFFECCVAVDEDGKVFLHESKPFIQQGIEWMSDDLSEIRRKYVAYMGDWRDSLTLPEGWADEPPFKEGEIVINIELGFPIVWRKEYDLNADDYRSPTEAEWKILKGEE